MSKMRDAMLAAPREETAVYAAGQMGFFLHGAGKWLMIDGYLSDYVDRNCSDSLTRWQRNYAPPISPDELDFVDFALFTHEHFDHTDPYTVEGLLRVNDKARFLAPPPAAKLLLKYGAPEKRVEAVSAREEYFFYGGTVTVTPFPAAHEELHPCPGGYAEVGYRVTLDGKTVCHTGDCCPYPELAARVGNCAALLAPINGRDDYRTKVQNIIGCFTGEEALTLARDAGAGMLVPGHYDLYDVNGADLDEFLSLARSRFPDVNVRPLAPGEKVTL